MQVAYRRCRSCSASVSSTVSGTRSPFGGIEEATEVKDERLTVGIGVEVDDPQHHDVVITGPVHRVRLALQPGARTVEQDRAGGASGPLDTVEAVHTSRRELPPDPGLRRG